MGFLLMLSKEDVPPKYEDTSDTSSPIASDTVVPSTFEKPVGIKRAGQTGGLGARKLITKVSLGLLFGAFTFPFSCSDSKIGLCFW